jgi:alkanesulfonate monooxygenase SsuD/methylene tetrahydromethanopterin reductase-like flavin-dependent oxidoreductase (luciferase family)
MTIAAHGPLGLRLAAEFGQAWNTFYPGKDLSPSEAVEATRRRSEQLSEFALAAGRDPEDIVRSLAVGYTVDRPFESLEAFQEFVGRYREAGIREFILGYMPGSEEMRVRFVTDPEMLGRLAEEAIPALQEA